MRESENLIESKLAAPAATPAQYTSNKGPHISTHQGEQEF